MKYKLYQGDCLEVMDKLIEEGVKVDAIITDPPYGTIRNINLDGYANINTDWDISINPTDIFIRCEKLLRENGHLILFSQEPYTNKIRYEQIKNLKFCYPLIWKKDHFANSLSCKKAPVSYFEDITVFYKKYDTDFSNELRLYSKKVFDYIGMSIKQINNKLGHRKAEHFFYFNSTQFKLPTEPIYYELITVFKIDEMDGFIPFSELQEINSKFKKVFNLEGLKFKPNVLEFKKDYSGYHPTQKPVALMEYLIKTYTNEGEVVLDFTMGSGSTGVACINTDRKFIGIELDKNYFDIAKKRIEEANR